MNKSFLTKIIIVLVILVAAFFIYRFVFVTRAPAETPGVESVSALSPRTQIDSEFLSLLSRIQDINLNLEETLNHPVWLSLENFHRELEPEPRGRRNPFSITGFDIVAPVATSSATTGASTTRGR